MIHNLPLPQPRPNSKIAVDRFNRPNGILDYAETGQQWKVISGTWEVKNNQVVKTSVSAHDSISLDLGKSDALVTNRIIIPSGVEARGGIALRQTDNGNCFIVYFDPPDGLILYKYDGTFTSIASAIFTLPTDAPIDIEAICQGSKIIVNINGVERIKYEGATFNQNATRFGMWKYDQNLQKALDFKVVAL